MGTLLKFVKSFAVDVISGVIIQVVLVIFGLIVLWKVGSKVFEHKQAA